MRKTAVLVAILLLSSVFVSAVSAVDLELVADGTADTANDNFTSAMALADLNNDGLQDIIVGSPGNDSFGTDAGAVYIFYGSPTLTTGSLSPSSANVKLTGILIGSLFGAAVDNAGDVNHDSIDDLVVGAPGYLNNQGAVYVFYGGSIGNGTADLANATITGRYANTRLGAAVSGAGDVNGDGIDDFLAGAPGGAWTGECRVYYGVNNAGSTFYPNLWELPANRPQPADFTSGINGTGNPASTGNGGTWGLAGADDGWDWQGVVYGGTNPSALFYPPNGATEFTLHLRTGGDWAGQNGDVTPASGGYGVKINITPEMYWSVQNGSNAIITFDWSFWDSSGIESNNGEVAWIKSCFTNSTARYYLGSRLDGDNDPAGDDTTTATTDSTNEIWYYQNWGTNQPYQMPTQTVVQDVTRYIDGPGFYYLDMGLKQSDWSIQNVELLDAYFDNISFVISPFSWSSANLIGPGGAAGYATAVSEAGDVNGDGYGDILVGASGSDQAFLYFGSWHLVYDFDLKWASITPGSKNASDNTNEPLADIQGDDNTYYRVNQNSVMYFNSFGTSGMAGVIHSAQLTCNYISTWWYNGNNWLRYARPPNALANTNIRPGANNMETRAGPFDLVAAGVHTVSDLTSLQIEFTNNDNGGPDQVSFDIINIVAAFSAAPNVTIRGNSQSRMGASFAPMGDLDGDGFDDFAVGAPNASSGTGAAHVFRGNSTLGGSLNETDSKVALTGVASGDRFGTALASGRVSLDNLRDLAVGAPGANSVYIFNGTGSMTNGTAATGDDTVKGANASDAFGASVAVGDVNGLGYGELLAGAPKNITGGKVYLYANRDEKIVQDSLDISYTPVSDPTINEGENISFGYSVNNLLGELTVRSQWLMDSSVLPGWSMNEFDYQSNYTSAGTHNVTVMLTDGMRSAQHAWTLTVVNVNAAPTVIWYPPSDVDLDENLFVNLSAQVYDADNDTITYSWQFNGAPLANPAGYYNFTTNYSSAGTYVFNLSLSDGNGHSIVHNWTVVVKNINRPPVIDTYIPQVADITVNEGETASFTVTAHDPDGDPVAVMWYYAGQMVSVEMLSYTVNTDFKSAGTKDVRVVVSDGELTVFQLWSLTIRNINAPPVIDAFIPLLDPRINEGEKSSFWISAHDPDGDPITVSWLLDSEVVLSGLYNYSFQSSPASKSTYNVQAMVSDGNHTTFRNWTLSVNHAPRITSTNPKGDIVYMKLGEELLFFIAPYDPDNDPLAVSWLLNDQYQAGGTGNSLRFGVGPSSVGLYRLRVTVSDGSLTDVHDWMVQVNATSSLPPTALIDLNPRTPKSGQEVIASGKESRDDTSIVNYTWDFGDGTMAYGMDVSHVYKDAGTYTVRLTVTDAEGNKATTTTAIAISPKSVTKKQETDWGLPVFAIMAVLMLVFLGIVLYQRSSINKLENPTEVLVKSRYDDDGNIIPREPDHPDEGA